MKKLGRILLTLICVSALIVGATLTASAHSGRTDGNGGHKDNQNKSGLGSYHYHCGGYPAHLHTNGYCPYTDVFPTGVSVKADKATLGIGEKMTISASVAPSNACDTSVDWMCSDTGVISLNGGTVEAIGYGTAVLTATTFNGKTDTLKITVKEITAERVDVSMESASEEQVYIGDIILLHAGITPENVDDPSIVWTSDNENVALVNDQGKVEALSEGTATIYATASNGVAVSFTLQVYEKYVEIVEFSDENLSLNPGDTQSLAVTVFPVDATNTQLTWSSSDDSIAAITHEGVLSANRCGTAEVTAASTNGITDTIIVTVSEVVAESIVIDGPDSVIIGDNVHLNAVIYPENTTAQEIAWSTSDSSIAVIDSDGIVNSHQVGIVTITASQKDVDVSFQMEILPKAVEQIEINSSLGNILQIGDQTQLSAIVYPADATYSNVTWTTSNSDIAVIDENGMVEAKSSGNVIVTAHTDDGFKQSYELTVQLEAGSTMLILGGIAAIGAGSIYRRKKRKAP